MKDNDINLAKSIKNYPLSIKIGQLFEHLSYSKFGNNDDVDVHAYIWNNVVKEYDPNRLLMEVSPRGKKMIDNVFELIDHFCLNLNYDYAYDYAYDVIINM